MKGPFYPLGLRLLFHIGNGNTLTINGTASDYVVIDITGTNNALDGALTLTGGLIPDHVLINFIGSGGNVQGAANGATLSGTFLIPNQGVSCCSLFYVNSRTESVI